MKIKRLELHGYKRFSLNNIKHFTYTPVKRIQTIIGTNGSGKSSLIEQLSPLPGESSDFLPGGYKLIIIELDGIEYTLRSIDKYSFIVNGEELNGSNKKTVQIELVKKYFNITPKLHQMLLYKKFTKMGPGERKDWLTFISGINFDYAFTVLKRTKDSIRDSKAQLRLLVNKMETLDSKLLTKDEEERYRKELKMFSDFNISLHQQTSISSSNLSTIKKEINTILPSINSEDNPSILEKEKQSLIREISVLEERSINLYKLLTERKELDLLTSSDSKSIESDLKAVRTAIKDVESIKTVAVDDYSYVYSFIDKVLPLLNDIVVKLIDTENIDVSKKNEVKFKEMLKEEENKLTLFKKKESLLEERIRLLKEELNNPRVQECPKCHHILDNNSISQEIKVIEVDMGKIRKRLTELEASVKDKKEVVRDIEERLKLEAEFIRVFKEHKQDVLLTYILDKDYDVMLRNLENTYLEIIEKLKLIDLKKEELNLLNKLKFIQDNKYNTLPKYDELEKDISIVENSLKLKKERLDTINKELKIIKLKEEKIKRLDVLIKSLPEEKKKRINNLRTTFLKQTSSLIGVLSTEINEKLTTNTYDRKLHLQYQKEINELNRRIDGLEEIVKAMSPTNGLIAETIINFLDQFMDNINNIISSIWTYRMEVFSRESSNSDINYKFPIHTENGLTKDISMASTSMQEIINVSFRILVMKLLGLEDYPLYLDEFAASFDEEHRVNAFRIIEDILEGGNGQIFIVSHYYSSYAHLSNSELIVLSDKNVTVEGSFNRNVEIG